ncbi:MAG: tetratricopeptide repeat protein [Bryobacteraceae bacterium]
MSFLALLLLMASAPDLERARDKQDRATLEKMAADLKTAAEKQSSDANAHYRFAVAQSYAAEVAMEMKDKGGARNAAEIGIKAAERAVALKGDVAEHHRILGTLCGQVIPANVLAGLKYGRCALDEVNKAIALDGKSAMSYLSRGVGNYYLPSSFGGGADLAIKDFQKALLLNPKLAEAHLWLGIAQRKLNRNEEARKSLGRALELNPNRAWAKEQLEKTPQK